MNEPELIAAWAGIAVTAVIGGVGWVLAAKANRQLDKTHRLARRTSKIAASALRQAAEANRLSAEAHRLLRQRNEPSTD